MADDLQLAPEEYVTGTGDDAAPLQRVDGGFIFAFTAMASPCEVWLETDDCGLAQHLGSVTEAEARRIERKYSRYRLDSALTAINGSAGRDIWLDEETAALLDYAAQCHALSGGLFDVTSGILRTIWRFDGSDRVPLDPAVTEVRRNIGWDKVVWKNPVLRLQKGMEIDLGGLGKEYAVDRALPCVTREAAIPVLVNFGGDLRVSGPRSNGGRWRVAIDSVDQPGLPDGMIELSEGALATSGDARRFLLKDGVRYSHILDPRTGRPVVNPPRSVTVAAATCIEAGFLSTLAMLHGEGAESFLQEEGLTAWWVR